MKANAKYTAKEILAEAGVENLDEVFGKLRVRIAGLRGIVSPDHVIKIPTGTKSLEVIVGNDAFDVTLDGDEKELAFSEEVRKVKGASKEEKTK
jgi:hypothetical protein